MVIKGARVYDIVWCLFRAVPQMSFGTLVANILPVLYMLSAVFIVSMLYCYVFVLGGGGGVTLPACGGWVGVPLMFFSA